MSVKWFEFKVWYPNDDGSEGGYEYDEGEQGISLEDAKDKYRRDNPGCLVLADPVKGDN